MSIALKQKLDAAPLSILVNGDRMRQPEFHRRYEAYPEDIKFELIGGTVYMASPLHLPHSRYDGRLGLVFELYCCATRGVEALHNATIILGERSEPQPDLGLRILDEYSGQSRATEDESVEGPPELLAEIAHSTRAIDMHQKRLDYRSAGVAEYLVLCVEEQQLHWFNFKGRKAIRPEADGVSRSRVFPGLWIHVAALMACDSARLRLVLDQGLQSPEHKEFVKQVRKRR